MTTKKNRKNVKNNVITFRLTDKDKEKLKFMVKFYKLTLPNYIKHLILNDYEVLNDIILEGEKIYGKQQLNK